jgi:hypothetical protein
LVKAGFWPGILQRNKISPAFGVVLVFKKFDKNILCSPLPVEK